MKVTVEEISPVQKRVHVEIPSETVKRELDNFYNRVKREARIKGFRPGKVPRSILERYYRPQAHREVIGSLVGEAFPQIVKEQALDVVGEPEIEAADIGAEGVLTFAALVPTRPAFEPRDYKGVAVTRTRAVVSPQEVEEELERIRQGQAQMAPVEEARPLAMGDHADIDFQGFLGGAPLAGAKGEGFLLELGSKTFVPGFEEQLVGAMAGESREVRVTFPEDYRDRKLAGKEVVFQVKVNGIKRREIPALDDNLARSLDGAGLTTLAELRDFVGKELLRRAEDRAAREMRQALADRILAANPFEAPPVLVEKQLGHVMDVARQQLVYGGFPAEKARALVDSRRDDYRAEAERQVRFSLLLDRIAQVEGITVDDAELQSRIEEIARLSDKPVEAISAEYQKENRLDALRERLRDEKVIDFLVGHAVVTLVAPPASGEGTGPAAGQEG